MALARLILQGDYTPLPEDKYSSAMSRCIKWLLTKEFSKRPSIAMVEEFVRKQRLTLLQSTSYSTSHQNTTSAAAPVINVQRQLGLGLAADQSIGVGHIQSNDDNNNDANDEDLDDDSLDGNNSKHNHQKGRERSGSADTRSTASYDDDQQKETPSTGNPKPHHRPARGSKINHNDDIKHHHHRRVQMADYPLDVFGDESIPPPQQQQQEVKKKQRPSTAGPTNNNNSNYRHIAPAVDNLPLEIFSPPHPQQLQQQQDRPRSSSHRQQETKLKEKEVLINMARAVVKLRREAIRYRKLLQMRDFFSFSTNHVNNSHDNSSNENSNDNNNNKKNDGIANHKLKEAELNISLLEYALDHHRLAESEAIRLDIVMTEKIAEVVPPAAKEKADAIGNDIMPVYLQADPRRRNQGVTAARQSSPSNNKNRLETKHINLDIQPKAGDPSRGILPVRSKSFEAVTNPRSRRVSHAVDDSEIIAIRPKEASAGGLQIEQQQQQPLAQQGRRFDNARSKPSQLFDVNVHFDRQVMATDPASPLQQLLANNSNSKRSPINNNRAVLVAQMSGLELPSMSPKSKDRKQRPASAAPASRQFNNDNNNDIIKSDKAMLYKHARHMSDIMAVLEKDPRYHTHEQGGVEAILHGDRPVTAATELRRNKARASRSRSRTRSRSPGDEDEKRVSPDPRQSAIARKQRMIMMGQVRPRTASAAAGAGAVNGGDNSNKKEKRRQDKGIMIRQQTSYNIITGDDHD